ncbi:zinc-dependent alcohol dehydrogenase family protein [Sphingosinicella terrae]|uniref:zinc-dependent alcohol dehydrogenase family protein n=1 Tax=Sphingosinicella terrae TaxID=2172047 RepID=UPI000E0D7DCD|nr:zinc-dependent alcohol dehydrogenase family protein [Sphingosinicella terrae]
MRAMQLDRPGEPLRPVERPIPQPGPGALLIEVAACGICRTDLHVADGDLKGPLPIVPGHEIVGRVAAIGEGAAGVAIGDRVGVPWLGRTCGHCPYCRSGRENLCDDPLFTGFTRDGGFASHCVADARFCFPIPDGYGDVAAAPLLCAGLIGYRSLKLAGEAETLGVYGFGAAAHILAQVAVAQGRRAHAFTRPGDDKAQAFARRLGCASAADSGTAPPEPLDAAIIFAPAGALVPEALRHVRKGGRVVCGGIHMSDIPAFPYADLWGERAILSVANLTRSDGREFLELAARLGVATKTTAFPLERANEALDLLRAGRIEGAAVLVP